MVRVFFFVDTTWQLWVDSRPSLDRLQAANVLLHSSDVLTRALVFDSNGNPIPLFGHLYFEVVAGAQPTLGDAFVEIAFTNTAPGAPLPVAHGCRARGDA
jgi:hypothetical protein